MAIKAYKGNDTFQVGKNQDLNACVGNNGFNDIGTYEYGYDKAVSILIDAAIEDHGIVDPIIYPLVFSARHRIELFLKKAIYYLEDINKIVNRKISYLRYIATHDIRKLWEYLKLLSEVDCRYSEPIGDLSPLIEDYYIIDLTGETFRYPFDRLDNHHLDDFSCINIGIFKKQYEKASSYMEYISFLNDALLGEYKAGTFTDGLSRAQIEEISKEIPKRYEWNEDSFIGVSESIKNKYSISSGALSRVLNIIQKHKEFSSNIGVVIPVAELTIENFKYFNSAFNEFHASVERADYFILKNKYANEICENIPTNAIYSLMAFEEIGYFKRYSEDYDPLVKFYSNDEAETILFMHLMDSKRIIEWIERGMRICGQLHFFE